MELNDAEIIKKALEEFQNRILKTNLSYHIFESEMMAVVNALDLINRQQVEIERLKWEKNHFVFKVDDLNGKLEKFKEYRDIKNGAYEREIERLQNEIKGFDNFLKETDCSLKEIKDNAIKEFAERLKMDWQENDFYWEDADVYKWIDNAVKEMVGEQDV